MKNKKGKITQTDFKDVAVELDSSIYYTIKCFFPQKLSFLVYFVAFSIMKTPVIFPRQLRN